MNTSKEKNQDSGNIEKNEIKAKIGSGAKNEITENLEETENIDISSDRCDCSVINDGVVAEVREKMPKEETLYDLAELFKVFGDSTRIKILCALFEAEMCVCDIAVLLNMTKSAISHQLRVLRQSKLVKNRKAGKIVYYSLDDDHVKHIFEQGLIHINEPK